MTKVLWAAQGGSHFRLKTMARDCDHLFLPLLKQAAGVILQNYLGDTNSEKFAELVAKTFEIAVITRADGAMAILREDEEVTLDPKRGIIYRGCEDSPACKILSM